jgi:hypothetical protein
MLIQPVTVPEGSAGQWRVERFEITKEDAAFSLFSYGSRTPRPGMYTRLMRGGTVVMSDTPAEMYDHYDAVRAATGEVLINGLGLGMVVAACLDKESVERVTVIEIDSDVISLVAPHYTARYGERLRVIHADAFVYKPDVAFYGCVWHDIWPDLCEDNLPEMTRLKRKYARRAAWQGCWSEREVRAHKRRTARAAWRWA